MTTGKVIGIIVGAIVLIILVYSFTGGETKEEYRQRILKEREEKDRFMKTSKESPFKSTGTNFNGLSYFEPDPEYVITAKFTPAGVADFIMVPTNDGKEVRYRRYGYAFFELYGKNHRLLILELADGSENNGHIFIPFGDATSANETYGAGRYLDVSHNDDNIITLDFNMAYNPYCAYAPTFSCPMPPVENLLSIPIEAGEKNYE